jgi:hypothetical protein
MRRGVRKTENQEDGVNNKNTVNNRTKRIGVVGLCLGVALSASVAFCVEPPSVEWIRTFSGDGEAGGFAVAQTSDNGFVASGQTGSDTGATKALLVKTDSLGNLEWSRTFGGAQMADVRSVCQTEDGGYVMIGTSTRHPDGYPDIIKTDGQGILQWERSITCSNGHVFTGRPTVDGGLIIVGRAFDRNTPGPESTGIHLFKTDTQGILQWRRIWTDTSLGSIGVEPASVSQTADGGCVVASYGWSCGVWMVRTDTLGQTVWKRDYPSSVGGGTWVEQTPDGGFIVTGGADTATVSLFPMDVAFLLKADSLGNITWERFYGVPDELDGNCVQPTSDGGYVIAAQQGIYANRDEEGYLVRTDATGIVRWTMPFTASGYFGVTWGVLQTSDGGYVVVGGASPTNSPYVPALFLMKLAPEGGR